MENAESVGDHSAPTIAICFVDTLIFPENAFNGGRHALAVSRESVEILNETLRPHQGSIPPRPEHPSTALPQRYHGSQGLPSSSGYALRQ